ncbi:MAG TPA: Calx-beta domain-containing protein [Pyrinomonadaceae bacterium]
MRHPWKLPLAVVCMLALAFLPLLPAPRGSAQAVTYTATDLGTLGGAQSTALGLDECGRVVGESNPAGSTSFRPYFWNGTQMTDLGTFGGMSGGASAVNIAGRVAGYAQTATSEQRPFVWTQATGTKADLGATGTGAAAYDINDSNQIVGQWEVSPLQDRAFVWTQATGMQYIGAPWGTPISAYGINNAGHIVGTAQTPGGASHAFLSGGGVVTDLGTLGGTNSFAYDLNESGVVVGHANIPSNNASRPFHAFRWTSAGGMHDLGTLGGVRSIAYGVNASGQIVGYAEVSPGVNHAFLWADGNANGAHDAGELKDLNTLAPAAGWTYEEARAVNDRGQIIVTAINGSNQRRAFLLTPDNAGPSPCDPTPTPTPTPPPTPTPVPVPGTLQFSAATYAVGEAGTNASVTVTRAGGSDGAVSVGYATSNGTAAAGSDYTAAGGTLNFAAGDNEESFTIPIVNDALDEPNETVNLTLSGPTGGATLGAQTTAVLTITDNDATPTLSVSDVTVTEGNSGTAPATSAAFAVTLNGASAQTVTVNYTTVNGTAAAPGDFAAASGTVTFNPGETGAKNVTVSVVGDTTDEPNETFAVSLSSPSNATFAVVPDDTFGVGNITDDDGAPSLTLGDATVTEGHAGTTAATFTVTLLPASGQTVTVNYATANGTATAGSDYAAKSGTLTFDPGQTSQTITVDVTGEMTPEAHEDFFVNLSSPVNATFSDTQGKGTINNDDTTVGFLLSVDKNVEAAEGNSGQKDFNFTVRLSHATVNAVTVNYSTANGTAAAGSDYTAVSNASVNIPAGGFTGTATVKVTGDQIYESDETFTVTLSGASSGATLGDAQAVGTIKNDEASSNFSFSAPNYFVTEGVAGITITVTRTGSTAGGVSVNYSISGGTATSGSDYTAAASGTLNFAAGEPSKDIPVSVVNDTLDEPDETVNFSLSSPTGGFINSGLATLTINDDDDPPTFQFSAATYAGAEGGGTATLAVTRTGGSNAATVTCSTLNTGTATPGVDFTQTIPSALAFGEGETSKTCQVFVINDTLDEADETVNLSLSGGAGTALGTPNAATLTITDDDATPSLSVADLTGPTAVNEFAGTATFTVTLSAASGQTVTVNYATANGTATAGAGGAQGDYSAVSGTITFVPGETTKNVGVPITNDALDEPDETFFLNLSAPGNATISDNQAVGTINDDEGEPLLSISDPIVTEGDSGTVNAAFVVTLSLVSTQQVNVTYTTADGPPLTPSDPVAQLGSDYEGQSGQLEFHPGETSKTINVAVNGDTANEFNETFSVNLSSPENATVFDGQGRTTIVDDDPEPSFSIDDVTVTEGFPDVAPLATFTVTLSAASGRTTSVYWLTADGTASAEQHDYSLVGNLLVFRPGETSKTVEVRVFDDAADEPDETFFVNLTSPSWATISDAQGVGTILNDDATRLQFSEAVYPAGESAHFVTVTVARSGDAAGAANVDFTTGDGTATERKDYTAVSGTLRFAAGETSKTFDVLLTEDAFEEPVETINLTLSNPTGGAALGPQASATVLVAADDNPPPALNPIDNSSDFVRQHYHDFLNREPDAAGLAFWVNGIESCGADAGCREVKRINASAAFFLSIEFQETGFLVYRTFKTAYGDATSPGVAGTVPVVRLNEFLPDTRRIGENLVVGPAGWELTLEANKNAYMVEFVARQRFTDAFPAALTPAQFVAALYSNAGVTPTASERQAAIDEFGAAATSADAAARARALRRVSEHPALVQAELRRAFVLMQYFGYLRRNPDDAPEPGLNFGGWNFWLGKLDEFNGDAVRAEMVRAFLESAEYRNRFGQ